MDAPRTALTLEPPAFYYDTLALEATALDIWETEYSHVMDSSDAIVDCQHGPAPLSGGPGDPRKGRDRFRAELGDRVASAYPARADGKVLFPFRRTFVIAYC